MKSDDKVSNPVAIRAVAVGKIKEKLENTGLAMLSLALIYDNPMDSWGELIITVRCTHVCTQCTLPKLIEKF